ncbi:MAG: DNA repair protein RecO [Ignavibacteria bacterium]|nr:DNA repair protein RecO [Ignavibacteria bacterium]
MSLVRTRALVLKSMKYSESSRIMNLFTEELGKVAVIHKGTRRNWQSGNFGAMGLIEAMIYFRDSREIQTLGKVGYLEVYSDIEKDLEKLGASYVVFDLLNRSLAQNDQCRESFALAIAFLRDVNRQHATAKAELLRFLMSFGTMLGIMPDISQDGLETFFVRIGFTLDRSEIDFMRDFLVRDADHETDTDSDTGKAAIDRICRICEAHLLEYSNGRSNQTARRIIDQF